MRDYDQWRRARLPIISALYELGISKREIAELVGVDPGTIYNDIRLFIKNGPWERPRHPDFAGALRTYARLTVGGEHKDLEDQKDPRVPTLTEALGAWLDKDGLMAFLEGVATSCVLLRNPFAPPERHGYVRLVKAILGERVLPRERGQILSISRAYLEREWLEYLHLISGGARQSPVSREDLLIDVTRHFTERERNFVAPSWDDGVISIVDEALESLPERERRVLQMRFGLTGDGMATLGEVSEKFNLTRERIRQMEARALARLRHPRYRMWRLGISSHTLFLEGLKFEASAQQLSPLLEKLSTTVSEAILACAFVGPGQDGDKGRATDLSIEALGLSERPRNCLRRAQIQIVMDLVQKSPEDLMDITNFGSRSLGEVREKLAEYGLRLRGDDGRMLY